MMKKTRDDDDTDVLLLPLSSREMRQCPVRAENLHRYFPVTELPPDDDRDEEKDDMTVRGKMVCTDVCNSWWILQGSQHQHQHQHSDGNHLTSYYHEIEVLHKTGFFGNLSHKREIFIAPLYAGPAVQHKCDINVPEEEENVEVCWLSPPRCTLGSFPPRTHRLTLWKVWPTQLKLASNIQFSWDQKL